MNNAIKTRVLYLIGSTHGLEQELLTTSDDKQEEEADEVGTKLMDEFMLFLSLKGKHISEKKYDVPHVQILIFWLLLNPLVHRILFCRNWVAWYVPVVNEMRTTNSEKDYYMYI